MTAGRHSVRSFTDRRVPEDVVDKIVKTALSAPSSKNTRSSRLMIVEDRDLIRRIAAMRDFGSAFLAGAPLVILVMGDESRTDLWAINGAISATYVQLAAESLGLGSCWVHVEGRPKEQNVPSAGMAEDYLAGFLPVPESCRILCAIAIGYPVADAATRRKRSDAADGHVIRIGR